MAKDASVKELHLSFIDQTAIRSYVRELLIFPFPRISYAGDAVVALREGLLRTLYEFPFLAGSVKVKDPKTQNLTASYPDPLPTYIAHEVFSVSYKLAANANFEFKTLQAEGFPPHKLRSQVFCPRRILRHEGLPADDPYGESKNVFGNDMPLPILRAEANFVPGGLIISVYAHHSVVDGYAMHRMYDTWSKNVTKIAAASHSTPVLDTQLLDDDQRPDPSTCRRGVDDLANMASEPLVIPEVTSIEARKPAPKLRTEPYEVTAKIIVISGQDIATLRAEIQALTTSRISTFVVLSALFCTQILLARAPDILKNGIQYSTASIIMEFRKRAADFIPFGYMGNLSHPQTTTLPITSFPAAIMSTSVKSLLPIALAIASSIAEPDARWLASRIAHLASIPDPSRAVGNYHYENGPDVSILSWQHIAIDTEWNIPGASTSKMVSFRRPHYEAEGGVRIMPRKNVAGEDYEILVFLEKGEINEVIQGLGEMVKRVIDA